MAQLELSVVLNLANFRTQLGKLAQASAAYYYPINLTIDQKAFRKQLAALGNIKPVIKIDDSQLDAARTRIGTLNKSLATLRRATSTPIEIKLKYVEVGKSSSAAAGQIGRAVSGRVRADQSVAGLDQKQLIAARNMLKEADVPVSGLGKSRSLDAYRKSIIDGMANAGKESIAGLAQGLKDGQSVIGQAAKTVGDEGVRAIKDTLGIASPSRVFKRIGEFAVDGLELGFLNGLKDFKNKSIAEIKEIVALMRSELAKINNFGAGGKPISAQGQFRQFLQQQQASRLRGSRAYTSPIGPLPVGSSQPYAQGTRGQFGDSGYEPRMVSRLYTGTPQFPSDGMMGPSAPLRPMGQFPMSGMMYPSSPVQSGQSSPFSSPVQSGQSSRLASPLGPGYLAVGKGLAGIKSAYGQAKDFLNTNKFPAAGAVAGLGSEFGNAIKQVLLFGTAYKALAFLTSLPGEAFEAAKGLATYKNQLQAVTAESGTFEQSFAFVDGLAARFNVPLDSARQGFIKLYASMEPAGFDQGQIEGLFTGISKASAAFGLSADKVDRVNYAFAQMASKGQIMSEELKGQLGDVLPGALGLFAEAAQMSIPEFSKAMEDGAFKGKAMEQVLGNVSILLNTKFGPAAEGAAKTLQGAVNQIQNNLSLMYQAFAPIVDGVAAAFGPQVNSLIKDVTDTVKVLTTTLVGGGDGFDTLSPRAQTFYAAVQTLEPALRQAGAAIADLGSRLAQLAPYFVQVLASVISFASSPLARAALMAALAIGTLTAAMKLLEVTGIKAVLKSLYTFIGTLTTGIPVACGIARVAVIGLKLVITGLFAGAVLIGLDFLVGKLLRIGDAANDSAKDLRGMVKELDRMAGAGDLEGLTGEFLSAKTRLATARKANQQALSNLRAAKDLPERDDEGRPINFGKSLLVKSAQAAVDKTFGEVIARQAEFTQATTARDNAVALKERQDAAAEEEAKKGLQKIDLSGGDGDGTAADKLDTYNRSTLDFIKLRLEAEKQSLDQRRQAGLLSETGYKIAVAELELESSKEEVAERLRLSRIAISQDNLSAADKALKLKDTEIIAERELSIAANKRNIAVEGARKELEGPFNDAIDSANFSIMEQQMLLENIRNGIQDLTPDQQAYLQVLRLTTGMSEDELKLLVAKSNVTRQILEQDIAIKKQVDFEQKLRGLREEIKLLLIVNDAESRLAELRNEYDGDAAKAQQIFNLEEVKRNIEATRALISDFVSSTASDYKGFLKAVISGEDAVDALKQFQAGLTDKVLTIFLDFTMAPVEKFFKESLGNLFLPKAENIPGLDVAKEVTKDPVQATNSNTNATVANTAALKEVAGVLTGTSLSPSTSELGSTLSTNVTGTIENVTEQTKAEGIKFSESLGKTVGAIGIAAGSIMGIAAGIGQIKEGGTSNVLGGIGSVLMSLGGAVGGFAGFFKGANGGVAGGGWKPFPVTAFANGGMVNGPTLGLVGEGKYNEAIVPLPDGRSIPVQMKGGGGGLREAMNGNTGRASNSPILNMSFQSTNINGVEYVSRDQLEQAMVATRRQAASDGAKRGMSMTLDKLQQSPSTRSRLGMGGR